MVNGSEDSEAPTIPLLGGATPPAGPAGPAGPTEPIAPVAPIDPGAVTETVPTVPTVSTGPPPGWYPDPWLASQRRYWTGDRWTLDTLPDAAGSGPPAPPPTGWGGPTAWGGPPLGGPPVGGQTAWGEPPLGPDPLVPAPDRRRGRTLIAVATVIGLFIGLGAAYAFSRRSSNNTASPPAISPTFPTNPGSLTPSTAPPTIQPADSADPGASSLSNVVVTQSDVTDPVVVVELPGGNEVTGETTLDVCNGTYPSESLRTARLQIAAGDPSANDVALSTEAVLYKNGSATTQAFAELHSVAARCPSTPVPSPVGEPTVATHFKAAPDASWPQVAGVERLAFDFTTTDSQNNATHSIAVYLRRGRALLGVYFGQPDGAQPAVDGQTTVAGIVNVFANRLAKVPASVVNGSVS